MDWEQTTREYTNMTIACDISLGYMSMKDEKAITVGLSLQVSAEKEVYDDIILRTSINLINSMIRRQVRFGEDYHSYWCGLKYCFLLNVYVHCIFSIQSVVYTFFVFSSKNTRHTILLIFENMK